MKKKATLPQLDFERCSWVLKALFAQPPREGHEFSIGITTTAGRQLVIDSAAQPIVSESWRDDVALAIVTNDETLSAALTGAFDPSEPEEKDYLFVWGGDIQQWSRLIEAVSAYSTVGVRTLGSTR